jgi:hypothetical protein
MDGISALTLAMQDVVTPKSPPRLSKDGAAVGLSFLDTSLRQNHVRRVTERIRCTEVGVAQRVVEVDVSLNLLDRGQWMASRALNELRERSTRTQISSSDSGDDTGRTELVNDQSLWVPIWRVPRRAVAPIEVRDSSAQRLTRLTQYESSRLLAAGMYRLLRSILRSRLVESARDINNFLYRSDRSRWLVQSALIALFTEQSGVAGIGPAERAVPVVGGETEGRQEVTKFGLTSEEFRLGERVLTEYAGEAYSELLEIALSEYILIVALPQQSDEHILSFDSPVETSLARRTAMRDSYVLRYEATLPANLRAYHLVAEADVQVEVRGMAAVSNSDRSVASQLVRDATDLIDRMEPILSSEALQEYWWLELVGITERLSELLRRRAWEARAAGGQFNDGFSSTNKLLKDLNSIREGNDRSIEAAGRRLSEARAEWVSGQLGCSLSVENDPSSSTAHAYWRRIPSKPIDTGRVDLIATMSFHDATHAKRAVVSAYALAVALIGAFTMAAIGRGEERTHVDAAVAILLLVPGFLYYRLELPRRNLILARLQRVPRMVAHLCLFSMVGLSILVVSPWSGVVFRILAVLGVAVPLCGALGLLVGDRLQRNRSTADLARGAWRRRSSVPNWYVWEDATARRRFGAPIQADPDVVVRSSEVDFVNCGREWDD